LQQDPDTPKDSNKRSKKVALFSIHYKNSQNALTRLLPYRQVGSTTPVGTVAVVEKKKEQKGAKPKDDAAATPDKAMFISRSTLPPYLCFIQCDRERLREMETRSLYIN
jgi:hypothetical protein